jgi:UDP-N-acetylglucosamine--N-acetylmuramyl-(pentapeptide) pyrophosphoryl-undecaprenol N-acetylglucosamine transferase
MGGFTSFGPVFAGAQMRLPTFIHESNAIPGKANKLNARFAKLTLLGFEECRQFFRGRPCEVVGTPVRSAMLNLPARGVAIESLGFPAGKPVLFAMGGSQGAKGLNRLALEVSTLLAPEGFSFIHLTGSADEAAAREHYAKLGAPAFVAAFSDKMPEFYAAASVGLSRSGAASLAELAAANLPAILIPYPFAAEDHQTKNAEIFSKHGAAGLISEKEGDAKALAAKLLMLANGDEGKLMRDRLKALAAGQAHEKVADAIERHTHA